MLGKGKERLFLVPTSVDAKRGNYQTGLRTVRGRAAGQEVIRHSGRGLPSAMLGDIYAHTYAWIASCDSCSVLETATQARCSSGHESQRERMNHKGCTYTHEESQCVDALGNLPTSGQRREPLNGNGGTSREDLCLRRCQHGLHGRALTKPLMGWEKGELTVDGEMDGVGPPWLPPAGSL